MAKEKTIEKICIVGLDNYPQLARHASVQYVGGESVQHVLLARAWRDLGFDVSMIVRDHGQAPDQRIDGIRALAAYREEAGLRGLRFLHPRLSGVLAALKKADADVYYQSPSSVYTGVTAWFCRRHGRRFIYRVASDANCIPGAQLIRFWRDRKLYEYGLRRADLVAVQTDYQRELLERNYGLKSVVVDMAAETAPPAPPQDKDFDVLWVSNLRTVKRPELLLELARRLPQLRFAMAGGPLPGLEDYFEGIAREARALSNVSFHGGVPYHEIGRLFDRARVFVNTSSLEGFPNTFLQAWMRGIPMVTFFDPDRLVERQRLGRTVSSIDEMAEVLRQLLSDREQLRELGERARLFALERYSPQRIAGRYLELLQGPKHKLESGAGELRVVQLGPGLEVRGGVSAVERLILERLQGRIAIRHIATMEDGSMLHKLRVFLRAVVAVRRELRSPGALIVHIHFASRGSSLRKFILARMVLRAGRPLILHAHGASFDTFFTGLPRVLQRVLARTLQRAERFIVLSRQWERFYLTHCGLPPGRVTVLNNPVRLPERVPERCGRERVQFLFLGRIGRRKGSLDLLRAFQALPAPARARARLVMAGDGETELLRSEAGADSAIEVLSWVDSRQRDELLAASDVFVLPSYEEGIPMALLEAMACGIPVITTPVGGIPDVVSDGSEGLLVRPGAVTEICQAMQSLIFDEEKRLALGQRARARAQAFDVETYAAGLLRLYSELLQPRERTFAVETAADFSTARVRLAADGRKRA